MILGSAFGSRAEEKATTIKKIISPRVWVLSLLMVTALSLAAQEADGEREMRTARESSWEFFVAPYGWLTGVAGTVVVDGEGVAIDVPFEDFLEKTRTGLMVYAEARRNKLFVAFDGTWATLGEESDGRLLDLDVEIRQRIYDIRVGLESVMLHNSRCRRPHRWASGCPAGSPFLVVTDTCGSTPSPAKATRATAPTFIRMV